MRISSVLCSALVVTACGVAPVAAFEIKDLTPETPPVQAFTYGLDQYNSGDKATAAEALDFAAQKGIPGAQWKLARMYADGDGVTRDDLKAFQLFGEVIANSTDDDGTSAPYVSNAYVRLGTYYRDGIPNTKVKPDFSRARQAFAYAASFFGNSDAQLNLARMLYSGEGGDKDLVQAAKWAKLSADKGNADAKALVIQICLDLAQAHLDGSDDTTQSAREAARWAQEAADYGSIDGEALLGHILFEGDGSFRRPVDGLMYLTIALMRSGGNVRWIADMHEEALSAATDDDWNAAKLRADQWAKANPSLMANSGAGSTNAKPTQATATASAAPVPAAADAAPIAIAPPPVTETSVVTDVPTN
ncbi:MAG TPA: tetratricopeptide repeat protein [Bauldia sp.]|nr:tetratricopeptide repeat protein [Bauldia sp.]